ncbi:alpha/beta hydrolase fold domain-containing protein [Cupriavidus basilensis]
MRCCCRCRRVRSRPKITWTQGYASRIRLRVFRSGNACRRCRRAAAPPGRAVSAWRRFPRGSIDDADAPARHLAATLPAVVVTVGYSLAPAAPFPAALRRVVRRAVLRWPTMLHRRRGVIDRRRIAVARGHDAGGNPLPALTMIAQRPWRPESRAASPDRADARSDHGAHAPRPPGRRRQLGRSLRRLLSPVPAPARPSACTPTPRRWNRAACSLPPALLPTAPQDLPQHRGRSAVPLRLIEAGVAATGRARERRSLP